MATPSGVATGAALAQYQLACGRQAAGDLVGAAIEYEAALRLDPDLRVARRQLALLSARQGDRERACELLRQEIDAGDGEQWLSGLIVTAMEHPDLSFAGELAGMLAALQHGSEWGLANAGIAPGRVRDLYLSTAKLRHDADQLRYLREIGAIGEGFDDIMQGYADTADRLVVLGDHSRVPLSLDDEQRIGRAYGRIVHLARAPRLARALSPTWDRNEVQRQYLERRPGVVVIDNFLSNEALASLYKFCLESTVWSGNKYANGRLGAFFFAGFNCPLLLQLAEEIRDQLPELIGTRHPLRQLWGFKNTAFLPPDSTIHADFAAVNVNCWMTPTSANLDESTGGMLIYDVDAPPSWDFRTYNERIDLIRQFLSARKAGVIRVPYRQNRAIIFNSDLFHATEEVRFRPDYRSHRINITMLYGERKDDHHHPPSATTEPPAVAKSSWRSAAFKRSRH